jgi:hypothetical protein
MQRPQIHKPSRAVSFGLPDRLSFGVRDRAMVVADRGANSDRESVRVRLQRGLTRHLPENAMAAKMKPRGAEHKKSKASPTPVFATSTLSVAVQNLINMVVVCAVSGTVLLGLLAAKHF